jgi:p-aminobenzoyl-glutamate transporter AbgT
MKNCKLCRLNKVCNDLPGICILFQYLAVVLVVASLGFLFFTQEILVRS